MTLLCHIPAGAWGMVAIPECLYFSGCFQEQKEAMVAAQLEKVAMSQAWPLGSAASMQKPQAMS